MARYVWWEYEFVILIAVAPNVRGGQAAALMIELRKMPGSDAKLEW